MSTSGFMLRWAAWQAAIHSLVTVILSYALLFLLYGLGRGLSTFNHLLSGVTALFLGLAGSHLLAVHRRKVRGWTWAVLEITMLRSAGWIVSEPPNETVNVALPGEPNALDGTSN